MWVSSNDLNMVCSRFPFSKVKPFCVVPRVTQPNLESLRDEFFDVVARIKVPKCIVFSVSLNYWTLYCAYKDVNSS